MHERPKLYHPRHVWSYYLVHCLCCVLKPFLALTIFIFLFRLRKCMTSQVAEEVKAIHTAMQVCLETASSVTLIILKVQ